MPEEYQRLTDVIDAIDLLRRWPGVSEDELLAMIRDKSMPAFLQRKRLKSPEGIGISFCKGDIVPFVHGYGEQAIVDWDYIVFNMEDVAALEKSHPELLWEVYGSEEQKDSEGDSGENDWIRCDKLANRWGWSPFDVLGIIGSGEGQLRYNMPYSEYPPLSPDDLDRGYVHKVDLLRWEAQHASEIRNFDVPMFSKEGRRLREENKSLATKLVDLESENAALRAEFDASRTSAPRTAAATDAASAKRVEEWKEYAALMVKVALDCGAEGPKERKRSDLQTLAKRHGAELPQVALDVLRDALPEDHVSRKPGAPRQG